MAGPKIQIVTSPSGEEMVVLSRSDYDALLEQIEDASDVAVYDARKADPDGSRALSSSASEAALKRKVEGE